VLLRIVFAFQPEAQLMNPHVPHKDFTFFAIKAARQVLNRGCVMHAVVDSNIVIALFKPSPFRWYFLKCGRLNSLRLHLHESDAQRRREALDRDLHIEEEFDERPTMYKSS
jgi:hypothetical protein